MSNVVYGALHILLSVLIPIANILVIVILSKLLKKKHCKSYIFILNLAAADLLVGLMCILETLDDFFDDDFDRNLFFCLLRLCFTVTPCIGSMLTLLLISLDRYLAVRMPLYYLKFMNNKCIGMSLAVLWLVSFLVGHMPLITPALQHNNYTGVCGLFYAAKSDYLYILCFIIFLPALFTIVCLHTLVGRIAYTHHKRIQRTRAISGLHNNHPAHSSHFKAARTVLIVIICFTLSWGPYYITGIVQATCTSCRLVDVLKDILFVLGEANSLLNPLIYTFYCRDIRSYFYKHFVCRRRKVKPQVLALVQFTNIRTAAMPEEFTMAQTSGDSVHNVSLFIGSGDFSKDTCE
ncbi:PREDICTED: glucose-dependent insulinotropic receptor [Nanorana parkeri]|uniref:glucose-dependent insulinotropic receptor n=1 Tax=Nanorana parkeri TaxID=125878 RepID=UPI0008545BE9|nr:PREDICTED: glucose-dependent insulinotropic receptor [Nanorana parkeri]